MQLFFKATIFLVALSFPEGTYTSVMDDYKDLDAKIRSHLRDYSGILNKKIRVLDHYLAERRSKLKSVGSDPDVYFSNPIHAYSMIHHLHYYWPLWLESMEESPGKELIAQLKRLLTQISNAKVAQNRLGWFLHLQIAMDMKNDLRENLFNLNHESFNLLDSLEIGKFALDKEKFEIAEKWLGSSLKNIKELNPVQQDVFNILGAPTEQQVQQLHEEAILTTKIKNKSSVTK